MPPSSGGGASGPDWESGRSRRVVGSEASRNAPSAPSGVATALAFVEGRHETLVTSKLSRASPAISKTRPYPSEAHVPGRRRRCAAKARRRGSSKASRVSPGLEYFMFRVMELRDRRVELFEGSERVEPPPAGVLRWIESAAPTARRARAAARALRLPPLDHRGLRAPRPAAQARGVPRPPVPRDAGLRHARARRSTSSSCRSCTRSSAERYLVTVHETPIAALEETWLRLAERAEAPGARRRLRLLPGGRRHRRRQLPDPRLHRRRARGARGLRAGGSAARGTCSASSS